MSSRVFAVVRAAASLPARPLGKFSIVNMEQRRQIFSRCNLVGARGPWKTDLYLERRKGKEEDSGKKSGSGKKEKPQKVMSADDWEKAPVEEEMKKVVEKLKTDLGGVRIGRAEPAFLANVIVDGKPLAKWGQIQVKDATTLTITLFDPTNLQKVVKGIAESELKLDASSDGRVVVVPVPRATKELRAQKVKQTGGFGENARNDIRKSRKKALDDVKSNKVPEDDQKIIEKQVQKLHDDFIKQIDQIVKKKEEELMK